jgi:predicted acyltransferase
MMFVAMTLCGFHATEILRSGLAPRRRAMWMFVYAAALLAAGFAASVWVPVIKPIYTVSFTLQAMGWCVLSLAVLYVATDIFAFRSRLGLPILFGRHCLFAYMAFHVPFRAGFNAFAAAATAGVGTHFGKGVQALVSELLVCCALVAVLKAWDALGKKSPGR